MPKRLKSKKITEMIEMTALWIDYNFLVAEKLEKNSN